MKILVPFGHNERGGSQLSWLRLVDALKSDAFSFVCWAFAPGPLAAECEKRRIPYIELPRSWMRAPWGLLRLALRLREEGPDVIYLHASRMIALLAKLFSIPCIERINMSRVPEAGGWSQVPTLDRFFTNLNTKVLAVSEAIKQQLVARGVKQNKIVVIRNFVDAERFRRPDLRLPTRQELGIPEDAIVVLNAGRMVKQKAQSDFLKVAAQCLPEDAKLFFLLVGDGPLRQDLEREAQALELQKAGRFRMLPFQSDVERIYAASDVLLHTAHWEPLANVLLEAMAAGLAIVATDVGGTREVVTAPHEERLFPAGDVERAVALVLAQAGKRPDSTRTAASLDPCFTPARHQAAMRELLCGLASEGDGHA